MQVPYTEKQRRLFHELAENPDARKRHNVSQEEARKLADEADSYARDGQEKPAKKAESFIDLSHLW